MKLLLGFMGLNLGIFRISFVPVPMDISSDRPDNSCEIFGPVGTI